MLENKNFCKNLFVKIPKWCNIFIDSYISKWILLFSYVLGSLYIYGLVSDGGGNRRMGDGTPEPNYNPLFIKEDIT